VPVDEGLLAALIYQIDTAHASAAGGPGVHPGR
jgi:hypothetical protein